MSRELSIPKLNVWVKSALTLGKAQLRASHLADDILFSVRMRNRDRIEVAVSCRKGMGFNHSGFGKQPSCKLRLEMPVLRDAGVRGCRMTCLLQKGRCLLATNLWLSNICKYL